VPITTKVVNSNTEAVVILEYYQGVEIYNGKNKVVSFVIKSGRKLTIGGKIGVSAKTLRQRKVG